MKKKNLLRAKIIEVFGSQADFAEFLKADESMVSRIVNGRRDIPESQREAWSSALRLKMDDLSRLI